jgi:DNA polymerase kappa
VFFVFHTLLPLKGGGEDHGELNSEEEDLGCATDLFEALRQFHFFLLVAMSSPPLSSTKMINPYNNDIMRKRKLEHPSSGVVPTNDDAPPDNAKVAAKTTMNSSTAAGVLIISASDKAGMEGIDRSKIDAVILRESGDSLYVQQQRRRDDKVNDKIRQLQQRVLDARRRPHRGSVLMGDDATNVDALLEGYQRQMPTRSTLVVVDMDMFYMACELLTRPHLQTVPACVGRGMILTSNYVARRYGVRSAMPGFIGDKLVEELSEGKLTLAHVPSNFELYRQKSAIVKDVLKEYDPRTMKSYSLDEAYLDIGPYLALHLQHPGWTHEQIRDRLLQEKEKYTTAHAMTVLLSHSSMICMEATSKIVTQLRQRVQEATGGLTCSAGVAPNVSLAKIASDKNKPNGQLLVEPSRVLEFVHPLSIRKIPGIGRVTEKILQQVCHVQTVRDLYEQRSLVQWLFKPATAEFLLKASVGCNGSSSITSSDFGMHDGDETSHNKIPAIDDDDDEDETPGHQKGISRERTFPAESDWNQLCNRLDDIARKTATDMAGKSVMAHTVTVKVKLSSFDVMSRSQSMKREVYIQDPEELSVISLQLLAQVRAQFRREHSKDGKRFSVRLLGVRCSNLISEESLVGSDRGSMDKYLAPTSVMSNSSASAYVVTDSASGIVNRYASQQRGASPVRSLSPRPMIPSAASQSTSKVQPTIDNLLGRPVEMVAPRAEAKPITNMESNDDVMQQMGPLFVHCPLCSRQFPADANAALNAHIDGCLNGSTIRQAIREDNDLRYVSQPTTIAKKKPKRLLDFWKCTTTKS